MVPKEKKMMLPSESFLIWSKNFDESTKCL